MSRGLSPRRRSSGSKGLERTATVSDVSPIAPEDSANAPDVHRSSALGFLLRKNPIACVPDRTRVQWIHEWRVRGDPPRVAVTPRAFYPRRARRLIAKVNTGILRNNRRWVARVPVRTCGDGRCDASIPRAIDDVCPRRGPAACRCASRRSRRTRDRAPM